MNRMLLLLIAIVLLAFTPEEKTDSIPQNLVYVLNIQREIGSTSWIHTQQAFEEANKLKPVCILIHMNTYGGEVVYADSIRTKILNSLIPVHVFIDNNAASAGALISIACDSIYMRPGANIGAATVVNQTGEQMPDKYQSYMRATIRSTAEAHGADTIVVGNDTIVKWVRDPRIAEAMVDDRISIPNVTDSGKVVTFTAREAIKFGFCEGEANSINEVIQKLHIKNPTIVTYEPSFYDGLKGFLTNSFFHGILILVILGGLYFELQTPGIGFPLIAAIIAAVLYFAPLYLDGLAANWEIIIFIIGVGLVAVEIFVIPGFGIAGFSGIALVILGLTLSLVNNVVFDFSNVRFEDLLTAFLTVLLGFIGAFFGGIYLTRKFFADSSFSRVSLLATQDIDKGYVGVDISINTMIGQTGHAATILRPGGKVNINSELYDAIAESGYIDKGVEIEVTGFSGGQLVVGKRI